ncbi:hypothetical protein [Kitasatospora sp. NRRL B-11411]|uniref:hypothetical protein n=1 Tax=Kitasatospora sp. NRRL B-11411 TaxID=1463822 RepID=UPI0004C33CDF|nr:hypothetical protein [Kitasatospora sp. NRRL B-11411]
MSTALPHPRTGSRTLGNADGDALPAPAALLIGPGRTWPAEARCARAQIRVGGQWRPARIEHWRLRLGSLSWSAQVSWHDEDGHPVSGWYLCHRTGLRLLGGW